VINNSNLIRNRYDWPVELTTIEKVDADNEDGGVSIKKADGWSMFIRGDELDGFVPEPGDWILTEQPVNNIATIIIEGRVIRRKNKRQVEEEHKNFSNNYRLEKLERYVKEGDELKKRVEKLPLPLRLRMARFAAESGEEFWIDSAGYEMYALEGAAALLRKVKELGYINDVDDPAGSTNTIAVNDAIKWIKDWWAINSKDHNPPYDYKKQMEIVPDFGDGHSGNTAGAAYGLAIRILEGHEV
jgi:hypothetical protein